MGAICADEYLRSTGQGAITTLGLALAYGLAVGVMVTAVAHISGGHLNPAVTIGFWVTKRLSTTLTVLYWIAQLLGAIAAGYLISALIPDAAWRLEAMNAINPCARARFHPPPRHAARRHHDFLPRLRFLRHHGRRQRRLQQTRRLRRRLRRHHGRRSSATRSPTPPSTPPAPSAPPSPPATGAITASTGSAPSSAES